MHLSPAEYVIKVFGGVRATARALNKSPSGISKWQCQFKGKIPTKNLKLILEKAKELDLDITADDLIKGRFVEESDGPSA